MRRFAATLLLPLGLSLLAPTTVLALERMSSMPRPATSTTPSSTSASASSQHETTTASALSRVQAKTRVRGSSSAAAPCIKAEPVLRLRHHRAKLDVDTTLASGLRKWVSADPLFLGDPSVSLKQPLELNLYAYTSGNPVMAVDPNGLNTVWLGGAGKESDTALYSVAIVEKMKEQGVPDPTYVPIGTPGGKPSNIAITLTNRSQPNSDAGPYAEAAIEKVTNASNDNAGQRNLIGYSYGSVVAAQSALRMANDGVVVDNLILVGSPIASDSDLYKALVDNPNIKAVTRIDIADDPFSDGVDIVGALSGNIDNHFFYTTNDSGQQDDLARSVADITSSTETAE